MVRGTTISAGCFKPEVCVTFPHFWSKAPSMGEGTVYGYLPTRSRYPVFLTILANKCGNIHPALPGTAIRSTGRGSWLYIMHVMYDCYT